MAKPGKVKKNRAIDPGPELQNSETHDTEDRGTGDPTNRLVFKAIANLSSEVNPFKLDMCATIEIHVTEISATIRGGISSLNKNI